VAEEVAATREGLGSVARQLRDGGDRLEQAASSVPDPPDAGSCSDGVAAVLAWFAESASKLVGGSMTLGDAVTESARTYERADAANAESLHALDRDGAR
jgi:hypothetical protein